MTQHVKVEHEHVAVIQPGMAAAAAPQEMSTSPFWDERTPAQAKGSQQASERGREEAEG